MTLPLFRIGTECRETPPRPQIKKTMTLELIRHIKNMKVIPAVICCVAAAMLTSCDSAIYDYEGDCETNYRVNFVYDKNMKFADAFAHEVKSAHLYAFDKSGILVWQKSERGESLQAGEFAMTLDLPAGDYTLLAWCGLENDGEHEESFSVPEAIVGKTRIEELQCRLSRKYDDKGAYSDEKLYPLFHGMCEVSLPDDQDGNDFHYTMNLTKDTNHVRVILQQLSGEPVNPDDFTFRIEEENGLMDYNNSLLPDEMITYLAHDKQSGTASLGLEDYPEAGGVKKSKATRATTSVSVAIADLTIARMVPGRKYILTVETKEGQITARIPLADYALMLKEGQGDEMSDEEYLDRQDEYSLVFFLDANSYWLGSSIIINSWRLVLDNVDL